MGAGVGWAARAWDRRGAMSGHGGAGPGWDCGLGWWDGVRDYMWKLRPNVQALRSMPLKSTNFASKS